MTPAKFLTSSSALSLSTSLSPFCRPTTLKSNLKPAFETLNVTRRGLKSKAEALSTRVHLSGSIFADPQFDVGRVAGCKRRHRSSGTSVTASATMRPQRIEPKKGQESVWDYPRPPKLEQVAKHIVIHFNGEVIADTRDAYRVLETSHPPVYYIPQKDVRMQYVHKSPGSSFCEWKGSASYWSVSVGSKSAKNVGWSYESPTPSFGPIKSHIAFYCAPMDSCTIDGENVQPQPGGFYGGWITDDVVGPFKGGPNSWGW